MIGLDRAFVPQTRYAKGNYFNLIGRAPFSRLIYPAPHTHGLGVHLTLDLAGQARFGPDVEWVDAIEYDVDPKRANGFDTAIRRYWPGLPDNALFPGYSGIRPKISGPNDPAPDFRIDGPEIHGVRGLVNLFGIESPGLTASLAIADEVMTRIDV
jgi:L-2-hydroxyglutarate oxidase LhgO